MKFTKEQLMQHSPCADGLAFAKSCDFDFSKIWNNCERGDWLIWLLRNSGNIDKPTAVKIAIACAEHVLAIFEKKYPNNKRSRKAIEAAIAWVKNPTEENRQAAAAAADAADAAYAAYAAYAAADADADAADATYAAYATYAAAYAAADADAAADAYARISERKWQADKIRELVACPFERSGKGGAL